MKAGWEIKQIGDILKLEYGKPLSEVDRNPNGQFPVYGANGEKNRTDKFYFDKPSIIVGRKGSAGEINLTENKFWPLDVTYFVTFDEKKHHINFIYYLLTSCDLTRLAKGVKPGINRNEVYDQKIAIPPLPEQRRIVAILDEAFAGIAAAKEKAEQNLKNAKEVFESAINSIEGKKVNLGDYVEIKTGKLDANAAEENGKYPFFTCSKEIFSINNFSFDCEAILLAGNNAVGDFNVKYFNGKFNAYQRTYVITANKRRQILCKYLYIQLLNSLKKFKEKSVGAATKFLKLGMIKEMQIILPSLLEQETIISNLSCIQERTEKLESIYQQKLSNLEELKKSLLQQAFSGAL